MLDLVRLRLNGVDDIDHYHRILRTAAEQEPRRAGDSEPSVGQGPR